MTRIKQLQLPLRSVLIKIIYSLIFVVVICGCVPTSKTASVLQQPAYLNLQLSPKERAADLVARMTLEEKIAQMQNQAPAIERLDIPAYNWWSEGLHGVARAGLATVFPQAIGLAASWDEPHMHQVATVISDEARAKHHAFAARDKRFIYQGLTLWSPNINIFRDPRWGRGQETYGEDPFLTGRMAVQFIKGLQGDDPTYLKTVATVKHFAVHSGPEPERHEFDAITNKRDLYDTYLPQFEMGVQAGVASLMCAYNRYNGEPSCSSEYLLQDILRDSWHFDGFVVSDCGAIADIHLHHKTSIDALQSAARAVRAGTDLNCGTVYGSLEESVSKYLLTETEIDQAVTRLFTARMKLGMFDPPEKVAYTQIPYTVIDSPKHRELALQAAQKSIVLLKNDNNTLPLKKDLGTLAVIGPNADQWLMLLGNYNGVPADPVTPLRGVREAVSPQTRVLFAQGSELADGLPMLYPVPAKVLSNDGKAGLKAFFFNNTQLDEPALFSQRFDNIDVNWQDNAPREDMDDDGFSVRWQGELTPEYSGNYQLGVISTCNTKVLLNGKLVASTPYHFRDEFGDPRTRKSDWIHLEAGKPYQLEVTAIETYADAQVQLVWAEPKPDLHHQALAIAKQADAVVMVMGLTARMEGEEMDIQVDGFRGGDRTQLGLPKVQQQLVKDVHALGKPVVLVLLNGSALALNWEQQHIPAIVEAWYPGQAAGTAIASVLFGDYNPAGRLPITFYQSVTQLPPFEDYTVTTQTYRYFDKEPLYPFGYGLSYSRFDYGNLQVSKQHSHRNNLLLEVDVTNRSQRDGEEVVQAYLSNLATDVRVPLRSLVAFKRVKVAAGSTQRVALLVDAKAFTYFDDNGKRMFKSGKFELAVGGGQPDQHLSSSNILKKTLMID